MAESTQIGGDGALFVGEDKVFRLELIDKLTGLPVDMSGMVLLLDVRRTDIAGAAIISQAPIVTGIFNPVRSLNAQRAVVIVTDTQMNLFKRGTYRHSWKRMDADVETVLAWGDFVVQKATAP